MADERSLPIPPQHREFTVKSDGQAVPREHQLLSASITLAANRIASARLAYADGAAAGGGFPLSEADLFKPGRTVEILAGADGEKVALFKGVVVRIAVKVRDHSSPQLVVDCRHPAMKLAIARRSASYIDRSDSEIIEDLLQAAGVAGEIEATDAKHKQLVQFNATDWDFLLARAAANGRLAWPQGDKLLVKKPAVDAAALTLQFGATLLEFDGEIDARKQFSAVRGVSWNPASQAVFHADGNAPGLPEQGNLAADELAKIGAAAHLDLRHADLEQGEAKTWADAAWLLSRLDKISGRGKCEGIATLAPGATVALAGLGARFDGKAFVSAVRHEFDLVQGWKTHVQFGGVTIPDHRAGFSAPPAGGLAARAGGLHIGVVDSNEDPAGEHRVKIRLPLAGQDSQGVWARQASPDAGGQRGFFFRPEIGDEVVVGFFDEDPRSPVILGMLHSSAKPAPLPGSDSNHEKLYQSRSGMRVYFNDEKKILTIDTPAGNSITLSEEDKSLVLADQNQNSLKLSPDGISIESSKALILKAGTRLALEAETGFAAKSKTELKLEGGTQAELSSTAQTKVTGAIVQIN